MKEIIFVALLCFKILSSKDNRFKIPKFLFFEITKKIDFSNLLTDPNKDDKGDEDGKDSEESE